MKTGSRNSVFACILLCVLLMAAAAGTAACGSAGKGKLKAGVRQDVRYWGYRSPSDGNYYGLEIDLAKKLAEKLGYDGVEFTAVTPQDREEKLAGGTVDCVIACYSITDERLETLDFSPPYYTDHGLVLVEKSSLITEFRQLSGARVGIVKGTDAGERLKAAMRQDGLTGSDGKGEPELAEYDSYADLAQALETGEADAACMDGSIAQAYLSEDVLALDETISEEQYGVATVKGSPLSDRISTAVSRLLDDGTVKKMIDKWN
ncbi:MAG: transporter substrate-binding domain-containing protein [Lachnospiraceae bacterium]|jgi:putative glutamine transport system substrate-binding protein|nr:transporter substrate-binding domain-containing protein [Lachnospiraceae bacterium]